MSMTILYLLYFLLGLQIVFKPNGFIKLEFLTCLVLTAIWFNLHIHSVVI